MFINLLQISKGLTSIKRGCIMFFFLHIPICKNWENRDFCIRFTPVCTLYYIKLHPNSWFPISRSFQRPQKPRVWRYYCTYFYWEVSNEVQFKPVPQKVFKIRQVKVERSICIKLIQTFQLWHVVFSIPLEAQVHRVHHWKGLKCDDNEPRKVKNVSTAKAFWKLSIYYINRALVFSIAQHRKY